MIEPTLGTAAAFVVGALGVSALVSGLRYGLITDTVLGAIMVFVAYYITTLGYVL